MKLLEIFGNASNGSPDIATDSTSMDDAELLRNTIRNRKKDIKWVTRTLSKKNNRRDSDHEEPECVGDGEGPDDELSY